MAEAGAKVLNAQAVEFAKEKGIVIYARATGGPLPGPDPSTDGTVVRRTPPGRRRSVVGVASERDVILLESQAPAADLLALLDEQRRRRKAAPHRSEPGRNLVISRENLHDEARLRDSLDAHRSPTQLVDGLAAVSVIGAGSTPTYAECPRRSRSPGRGRDTAQRCRHLVISHHLDGAARSHRGCGPCASLALHRIENAPLS